MNSTIPKRHAGTLRNRNVPFQLKNRNGNRNGIDSYATNISIDLMMRSRQGQIQNKLTLNYTI